MNQEQQLKPIFDTKEEIHPKVELPEIKKETPPTEEIILKDLPSWSIEPPIEIKRSHE